MSEDRAAAGGPGPGSRIAGYLIEQQIGHGGMAVVFRATDERLDRRVALKILSPALAQDEAFRQRFIRESRAAAAVDDPHIVPVFEAGEATGVLFIAMRYVGGDVRTLLAQSGPLPAGRAAEIISQVASALDAAHDRGLVHRDVKPANMLLDSGGGAGRPDHVYLSDFGVSKAIQQTTSLTATGQFLGSLDYVAPEQIEGRNVDGRADQYGLACTAFELFTGDPPFRREEPMAVMYAQLSAEPPVLTGLRPDLPRGVDLVFGRALSKNPAARYDTCREFADALRVAIGLPPYDSPVAAEPMMADRAAAERMVAGPVAADRVAAGPVAAGPVVAGPVAADRVAAGPVVEPGAAGPGAAEPAGAMPAAVPSLAGGDTLPGTPPGPWSSGDWPGPLAGQPARQRRRPAALLGALAGLLVLGGGGGAYMLLGNSGKAGPRSPTAASVPANKLPAQSSLAPLSVPRCTSVVAQAPPLSAQSVSTALAGPPRAAISSPDGKAVFVTLPTQVQVLVRDSGTTLARQYPYTVVADPGLRPWGMALTADGRYLVAGADDGIVILSVPLMEQGAPSATVADLPVPGLSNGGAEEVAVSPDGFAFVVFQAVGQLAVFDLAKAIGGAGAAGSYVGSLALGYSPAGIAISPDGRTIYVTGQAANQAEGTLSLLDLAKAEVSPGSSVISGTAAGCGPGQMAVSADGSVVWVAARGSDAVLGFSAARLRARAPALLYDVAVGQSPASVLLADGGKRLIVTDSAAANLAVIDVGKALAREQAVLGYVAVGPQPGGLAMVSGTSLLLVADGQSNDVRWIDLSKLL